MATDPSTGLPVNSLYVPRATRYAAQLVTVLAQLALVETQIATLLGSPVESFDFSTGGGERQKVQHRDVQPLFDRWDNLTRRADFLEMKINGGGLVNMNMRRS